MADAEPALRGRQAEARRNDEAIVAAALAVLSGDPRAPMSAVAARASVGQASLYRRYATRGELLVEVARRGMTEIRDRARAAEADGDGIAAFLRWYATSGVTRLNALLGSFDPPDELYSLAHEGNAATDRLVERARESGVLREDVSGADLALLAAQIGALEVEDAERTRELRERYVAIALVAITTGAGPPLPGPAPSGDELMRPWVERRSAPPAP